VDKGNVVYRYNRVYSAIKKDKIMKFPRKWIELEIIILGEISQTQKVKLHIFFLICQTRRKKIIKVQSDVIQKKEKKRNRQQGFIRLIRELNMTTEHCMHL
jgi:hypothetical protein